MNLDQAIAFVNEWYLTDLDADEALNVLMDEVERLQRLVDQAAKLKTVGGIRPGYQERGQWERGTLPPPASATDGPAVVGNPERNT